MVDEHATICCLRRSDMEKSKQLRLGVFLLATWALIGVGCTQTHQARKTERTGFLGDYSDLQKGEGDQSLEVYWNEGADFKRYDKIMIAQVKLYKVQESLLDGVSDEDKQMLVDALHVALDQSLRKDYKIVDAPGSGVLEVRAAIGEADDSEAFFDFVSNLQPGMRVISGVKRLATGTDTFVGQAAVEAEIRDSQTKERFAAMVDRRVGQKTLKGVHREWGDVLHAFEFWADQLRTRLQERKKGAAQAGPASSKE